ncbi:MAG: hypothetical protein J0H80_18135 [Rhizobiales bacterium]|nr:hypothetical protein [Hyphomicrobiales bacterium]
MSKQSITIIQTFRAERRITVEVDAAGHERAIEEVQNGDADIPAFDDPVEYGVVLQSEEYE